jgi:hypothetical protein
MSFNDDLLLMQQGPKHLLGPKPPYILTKPSAVKKFPPMQWLVDKMLPKVGLAVLFGEPAHGKSFIALDIAMNLANGSTEWRGVPIRPGPVVYVYGEGRTDVRDRFVAWEEAHPDRDEQRIEDDMNFLFDLVQVHEKEDIKRLMLSMDALPAPPRMVIIDTLAQNALGVEENSAKDIGLWLYGASLMRDRYDCLVLIIHHAAKNGDRERGSAALKAGVDAMFKATKDKGVIELTCTKVKASAEMDPMHFRLQPMSVSCVLVTEKAPKAAEEAKSAFVERVNELAADIEVPLSEASRMLVFEFPEAFGGKNPQESARKRLERERKKLVGGVP